MFAIRGSGFGLYGYLPALVDGCGQDVALPERYRPRFEARPELARYASRVRWAQDDEAALALSDGAVFAVRPEDQERLLSDEPPERLNRLLLEKPLGASPASSLRLHKRLSRSGKTFRVGHIFRYTGWARHVLERPDSSEPLSIRWGFLAHHFRAEKRTWKRRHAEGGGALRFYGVQLIALLSEAGYSDAVESRACGEIAGEPSAWDAVLTGPGLPECRVSVHTRAAREEFGVSRGSSALVRLKDPFETGEQALGGLDRRVPLLTSLCRSLWEPDAGALARAEAALELWARVEERTEIS